MNPRLIDANAFEAVELPAGCGEDFAAGTTFILEKLDAAPTVDAEPIRHAHWQKEQLLFPSTPTWHCSACEGYYVGFPRFEYCPACGAKMDEVTRE